MEYTDDAFTEDGTFDSLLEKIRVIEEFEEWLNQFIKDNNDLPHSELVLIKHVRDKFNEIHTKHCGD